MDTAPEDIAQALSIFLSMAKARQGATGTPDPLVEKVLATVTRELLRAEEIRTKEAMRRDALAVREDVAKVYREYCEGRFNPVEYQVKLEKALGEHMVKLDADVLDSIVLDRDKITELGGPRNAAAHAIAELSGISSRQFYTWAKSSSPSDGPTPPSYYGEAAMPWELANYAVQALGGSEADGLAVAKILHARLWP